MALHRQILFSERHGYTRPSEVLIVGDVPQEVSIAISSALTRLMQTMDMSIVGGYTSQADELGQYIWTHLMGKSLMDYQTSFHEGREAISQWIQSKDTEWFRKLDLIEFALARI